METAKIRALDVRVVAGLIALVAVVSVLLGLTVTQDAERIASIWLANGFALGAVLLLPRKDWPVLIGALVGALVFVNLLMGDMWWQAAGLALASGLEVAVAAWCTRRWLGEARADLSRRWLTHSLGIAGGTACVLSATGAGAVMALSGAGFMEAWATYFPAHLIGLITLTPITIALLGPRLPRLPHTENRRTASIPAICLLAATASVGIFAQDEMPVLYLIFPVLIFAAFRGGVVGAAAGLFVFTSIATALTIRGYGPLGLVDDSGQAQVYFLQLMILIANLTIMPVALALADRAAAYRDVSVSAEDAREANRAKDRFLANMSHEIRTPLNGILGFSELLTAGDLDQGQRHQVEVINTSATSLLELLNDILDLSKVQAGQMTVVEQPLNLTSRIEDCIALVCPMAEAKGLRVSSSIDPDLPAWITGDNLRFRQVMLNLLGNAVKFTALGSITVTASRGAQSGDAQLRLEIADRGIGISGDRLERVFEEFMQADETTASNYGGTGLGLAISRKLCRMMGGDLRLESDAGSGTVAIIELPLTECAAPPTDTATTSVDGSTEPLASHSRILLVDDVEINREIICAMLDTMGQTCEQAADGSEAVEAVAAAEKRGLPYDIVLMDMRMPQMDGIEATRRIRAMTSSAPLRIIGLTANAFAEDAARCRDAGMESVMTKPVSRDRLALALQQGENQATTQTADRTSERMARLGEKYRLRKLDNLQELSRLIRAGEADEISLAQMAEIAHQMAGSAGMFGDGDFGDRACALEDLIRLQLSAADGERNGLAVNAAVEELQAAA